MFQIIRSHLLLKMIVAYLLLLLLPTVFFCGLYLKTTRSFFAQESQNMAQDNLARYCQDIERDMHTCQSLFSLVRHRDNFLRFLNGQYQGNASQLVLFYTEMKSMFDYATNTIPFVEKVRVYVMREDLLEMGDYYIQNIDALSQEELNDPRMDIGFWTFDAQNETLRYRRTLRKDGVDISLGVFEISCSTDLILDRLEQLSKSLGRDIFAVNETDVVQLTENGFKEQDYDPSFGETCFSCQLATLPMEIFLKKSADGERASVPSQVWFAALLTFISFALLGTFFFLWVANLSRRIVGFKRHLSNSMEMVPDFYQDEGGDEFSELVHSFNGMLQNNSELINRLHLEQLRQQALSYRALQAQIDPHFLYNALESIRMLAEVNDEEQISDMIFALSRLMRYIFSVHTEQVSLSSELDLVEQYLKLQEMRLGNRLQHEVRCPPELGDTVSIPHFTVQPLVENAIKYGLGSGSKPMHLWVEVEKTGSRLQIYVTNDGAEMEAERQREINSLLENGKSLGAFSSGTGIGLDNINTRMRYLYPESFSIQLLRPESGKGFCVTLSWDLMEQ